MTTSPGLKCIRTDEGEEISISAGAVEGEARVLMVGHLLVVVLNSVLPGRVVCTKPASIAGRPARDARNVREGIGGKVLGIGSSGVELRLLGGRTTVEAGPLGEGAGNCEGAGQLHLSDIPNSSVEVLDGTVGIDVGEEGRWPDRIISSSGLSEVVRSGD